MGGELTRQPTAEAGFTLIELMVVVSIISVLAIGATLTATRSGGADGPEADMTRFRETWQTERDLAIAGQTWRGLDLAPDGLHRAAHGPGGWDISDTALPLKRTPVLNARPGRPGDPVIVFLANGRSTPFEILFPGGSRAARRCESDGWRALSCGF